MALEGLVKIDGIQITRNQLFQLFPALPLKEEFEEHEEYEDKLLEEIINLKNQWLAVVDDENKINEEGWFYDENLSEIFYLKNNMKRELNKYKKSQVYGNYVSIAKSEKNKVKIGKWNIKIVDNDILNLEDVNKVKSSIQLFFPPCCFHFDNSKYFIGFVTNIDIGSTPSIKSLDTTSKFDLSHFKELFPNFTDPVTIDMYLSTNDCLYCF